MSKPTKKQLTEAVELIEGLGAAFQAQLALIEILNERVVALEARAKYSLEDIAAGKEMPEVGFTRAHRDKLVEARAKLTPDVRADG